MKRLLMILLICLLCTSTANAATMYVTEQSWSYFKKCIAMDFSSTIYCEDEAVNVIDSIRVPDYKWDSSSGMYVASGEYIKTYVIKKHGRKEYIPSYALSYKKPKYTYKIQTCNKKLTLKSNTKIKLYNK